MGHSLILYQLILSLARTVLDDLLGVGFTDARPTAVARSGTRDRPFPSSRSQLAGSKRKGM
jgi:hypothetical protein